MILSLGTDVGGSIRAPAAFCGCYGMKGSIARLSGKGKSSASPGNFPGQIAIPCGTNLFFLALILFLAFKNS